MVSFAHRASSACTSERKIRGGGARRSHDADAGSMSFTAWLENRRREDYQAASRADLCKKRNSFTLFIENPFLHLKSMWFMRALIPMMACCVCYGKHGGISLKPTVFYLSDGKDAFDDAMERSEMKYVRQTEFTINGDNTEPLNSGTAFKNRNAIPEQVISPMLDQVDVRAAARHGTPWGIELFSGTCSTRGPARGKGVHVVSVCVSHIRDGENLYEADVHTDLYGAAVYYDFLAAGGADTHVMRVVAEKCLPHAPQGATLASLAFVWNSLPCETYSGVVCNHAYHRAWGCPPIEDPQPLAGPGGASARVADIAAVLLLNSLSRLRREVERVREASVR